MAKKTAAKGNLVQRPIRRWAPVFILPTFAAFCIGFVWPFLQGIYLSFCNFNTPKDANWVGSQNYVKVFSDAGFLNAFKILCKSCHVCVVKTCCSAAFCEKKLYFTTF